MSRSKEIKYKVWDSEQETFDIPSVYRAYQNENKVYTLYLDASIKKIQGDDAEKRFIILPFTSYIDMDDNDIYLGDIVELIYAAQSGMTNPPESLGRYVVIWSEFRGYCLRVITKNWYDSEIVTEAEAKKNTINPLSPAMVFLERDISHNICRVIGNIFENPNY
jgi:hypothetical protein